MSLGFAKLKPMLMEYKVYDAWPYAQSLIETIHFMQISYLQMKSVYDSKEKTIRETKESLFAEAIANPGVSVPFKAEYLEKMQIDLGTLKVPADIFLRKTTLELFHYARICLDRAVQVTNFSLLGNHALSAENATLKNVEEELKKNNFTALVALFNTTKTEPLIKYLIDFDNYIKHIRGITINIETNIFTLDDGTYSIAEFSMNGRSHPRVDALEQSRKVVTAVEEFITAINSELSAQIPNSIGTEARYQNIKYSFHVHNKACDTETSHCIDYMVYFLEVKNSIDELPNRIYVMPVLKHSDGSIYTGQIPVDVIFITKEGQYENGIVGKALLTNPNVKRDYREYCVEKINEHDLAEYIITFGAKYAGTQFELKSWCTGRIIWIDDAGKVNK